MSIVKYDIHTTYQLTSVGINQKKKLNENMCNERKNSENGIKSIKLCLERMRKMLFIWWIQFSCWFSGDSLANGTIVNTAGKLVYLFFVVACCVMPFYLETNNEKVMNKFQWFFGISTWSHDSMKGRGGVKSGWKLITIYTITGLLSAESTTATSWNCRR